MNDRQLIADLLSALEYHTEQTRPIEFSLVAIEAAREYLRKPAQQQEPAGEVSGYYERGFTEQKTLYGKLHNQDLPVGAKLYTSPPASKPWAGLTDEDLAGCDDEEFKQARYWENKLKEKNT